jgi:hypothetical protein
MALPAERTRENPAFTLVSQYTVARLNKFPSVRVTFDEACYLVDLDGEVTEALDLDSDGRAETLRIPTWADVWVEVGRTLALNNKVIGTVAHAVTVTPEDSSEEEPGDSFMEITLNLAEGPEVVEGQTISLVSVTTVGTLAYRRAKGGMRWELFLDGTDSLAMTRMQVMLGRAYARSARAVLMALGLSEQVTDLQIEAAVQALGAQGINLDGILASEGERLELDRQAGVPTGVLVLGDAP